MRKSNSREHVAQSPLIDIIVYSVLQDENKPIGAFKEYSDNISPNQTNESLNRLMAHSKSQKHFDHINFKDSSLNSSAAHSEVGTTLADKAMYMNQFQYNMEKQRQNNSKSNSGLKSTRDKN